ncbi:MAG: DUF6733 family protein [Bacteroidota bacterium]
MKIRLLYFFLYFYISITSLIAQTSTFSIALNQDNAFGFAPAVYGSFNVKEKFDFTYYGIFWTNHAYTNEGGDAWTETGIGLGFTALQEKAYINPSLGFTHGSLLSNSPSGNFGEGIVPSVVAFYADEKLETELYFGYYKALRDGGNSADFILYWAYPGYIFSDKFSAGLHYEQFYLTRDDSGISENQYQWLGAYVKFSAGDKYTFRFSFGDNLGNNPLYSGSYYKLGVFVPLL